MRAGLVCAAVLVLAGAAAGCDDDNAPGPGTLDVDLDVGARVVMVDTRYRPDEVTVRPGELVAFSNRSDVEHTVTSDATFPAAGVLFDSGRLRPGEEFTYLTDPDDPRSVIEYHCEVHPDEMRGRIVVTAPPRTVAGND